MDGLFIYLYVTLAVTSWIPLLQGTRDGFSVGLAVIQGQTSTILTQKNAELTLNCSLDVETGLGTVNYTWYKDGEPVDVVTSKRIQVQIDGSLYFRRVLHRPKKDKSDEGRYICKATLGKIGTVVARDVTVQIAGIGRKFDVEPESQQVPVGGVARFQCQIHALPAAMYSWERDNVKLPQNDNRYLLLSSGILQITDVIESDRGSYRCYATQGLYDLPGQLSDIDDGKYSQPAMLDILKGATVDAATIVASSHNVTVHVGRPALLECLVQGYTGNVQWKKEGGPLVPTDRRIERVGTNLHILVTDVSDNGKYQCVAGSVTASMILNVIKEPVITFIEDSTSKVKAQWIYLKCSADGFPKPTITWLKDGKPINYKQSNYDKRDGNQELVIVQSDTFNSGYYQCVATNDAGSTYQLLRVNVYLQPNAPASPTNVHAVKVTKTDIMLEWDAPEAHVGFPVMAYSVHYKEIGAYKELDHVITEPKIELKELSVATCYAINIGAYSNNGAGPMSDRLEVCTLEDVPSKAPSMSVEPHNTSLLVKWKPLMKKDANGVVTQYKVFYRRKDQPDTVKVVDNIPGSTLQHTIDGLTPHTEYEVYVLAGTAVGYSTLPDTQWQWLPADTDNTLALESVQIKLLPLNSSSVNATWSFVEATSIQSITLQLKSLPQGNISSSTKLNPDTRYYVLYGLDKDTTYELLLTVSNMDGSQSEVIQEVQTSNIAMLPVPTNLHVTLRTQHSLNVAWYQLQSQFVITQFTVKYSQTSNGAATEQLVTSESSSILLENLQTDTEYQICVQAQADGITSLYSEVILETTNKDGVHIPVLSAPRDLQVETLEPGKVRIQWSPPAVTNGDIKSYIILYTRTSGDDGWLSVSRDGTVLSTVLDIHDTPDNTDDDDVYQFKMMARTLSGTGEITLPVSVNIAVEVVTPIVHPTSAGDTEPPSNTDDRKLGIIIGISIGVFCIIICIIIILLRHRCWRSNYSETPQTQPTRIHGNGHIPGNGNGHATVVADNRQSMGVYEMEAYTPMLDHLPENRESDSKGGGTANVILTPNGAKVNGFLKKNGVKTSPTQNGHMTTFLPNMYKEEGLDVEETRGLIAAMLGGGGEPCMTGSRVVDDSFTTTRYEDRCSLDDIDHSSCEDIGHNSQVLVGVKGRVDVGEGSRDSGKGSAGDSEELTPVDSGDDSLSDRNSCPYDTGSIPRYTVPHDTPTNTMTQPVAGVSDDSGLEISSPLQSEPLMVVLPRAAAEMTMCNDIPLSSSSQASTSSSCCEDTCHDGGTKCQGNVSSLLETCSCIPHKQPPTSVLPQATGSDRVHVTVTPDTHTNCQSVDPNVTHNNSSSSNNTCNYTSSPTAGTSSLSMVARHGNQTTTVDVVDAYMNSSSSNGAPPQFYSNGGVRVQPQGDYTLNCRPTIPQTSCTEGTVNQGTREITLAQIPQDAAESAKIGNSSPRQHYQV